MTGVPAGLETRFLGRRGPLFWLALKTSVLTVLTLGIYRFWMKTRLRRYYWSSVKPGGHPLEYVGQPLEKLLGFLIAVVILAFYIGVVNLVLMFLSFAIFHGNVTAYVISFLGVLPIWFFALYRARRYVLARTRWRGMRFGLEPGAWGYAWRGLAHWAVTILSLGLLWPRMTFWLEKYKTDRTVLGTFKLHQGGDWRMLYRDYAGVAVCLIVIYAVLALAYFEGAQAAGPLALLLPLLAALALRYRVRSLQILANHKTAGPLGLDARPRVGRVIGIYSLGYGIVTGVVGVLTVAFAAILVAAIGFDTAIMGAGTLPGWLTTGLGLSLYFLIFVLWGVLGHVFVRLPLWQHYAETLTVTGAGDLSGLRQRDRDEFREAEGFAEALDLGASI